jgi:Phage integrase, N-terminal SAM-like domain
MSDKPISPLRQRMIDDMTARRFKEKVQNAYVRHVRNFGAFLGRSPDTATSEDLCRHQMHMAQHAAAAGQRPLAVLSPSPTAAPEPGACILATELARHHRFRRQDRPPPAPAPRNANHP